MTRFVRAAATLGVALLFVPAVRAEEKPAPPDVDKRLADLEKQLNALTRELQALRQDLKQEKQTALYAYALKHVDAADVTKILQEVYKGRRSASRWWDRTRS